MRNTPTRPGIAGDARGRRGVATVEFVFVLPLLMFLSLLMIFFCKGMLAKQGVLLSDRQLALRQAKPELDFESQDATYIKQKYFQERPVELTAGMPSGTWNGSRTPEEELVVANMNSEAGRYANATVGKNYGETEAANVSHEVGVSFPRDSLPLSRFANDVGDSFYCPGFSWKHPAAITYNITLDANRQPLSGIPNVRVWGTLRDLFFNNYDDVLVSNVTGADLGLRDHIRQLYLKDW